jgi:hypothetical protein
MICTGKQDNSSHWTYRNVQKKTLEKISGTGLPLMLGEFDWHISIAS